MRDWLTLASIFILLLISTTILFSVEPRLFPIHFLYILVGIGTFIVFSRLDRILVESFSWPFYLLIIVLLLVTLTLGILSHGAVRWISVGPVTLQPSEFAKPAVALLSAWILSKNLKYGFLISLFPSILMLFLVFIQPDLGTAAIVFIVWLGAVLGSNISFKTVGKFFTVMALLLPLVWFLLAPYQKQRITSFVNPGVDPQGSSYQSLQAMIAAGSGGLFGRGLGQGSQTQLAFLPAHHTDFVFASIGEELGFWGMGLVLFGFLIMYLKIFHTFSNVDNLFAKSAIAGIFLYLVVQTFVNIGMNLGLLPVVGVPLPLVSAGGSALVGTMMALGLIIALRK